MKMFSLFTFSLLFGVFFHASRSQELCADMPSFMTNANQFDSERINGGQSAPSPIPWHVLLTGPYDPYYGSNVCGGTILNENTILSAANCFFGNEIGWSMRAGSTEFSQGGQTRNIAQVIWNENPGFEFNDHSFENNFVILRLDSALEFNNDVQPACLPSSTYLSDTGSAEPECFTSGFGSLFSYGVLPGVLQYVRVPSLTNDDCNAAFLEARWPIADKVTDDIICAGFPATSGKATCRGDSGGPFVCNVDGKAVITGVVSRGFNYFGCAGEEYPGTYARVTHVLSWIQDNFDGIAPPGPTPTIPPSSCENRFREGDGFCEDGNNHEGCSWDGGDCCPPHDKQGKAWDQDCEQCECLDPNCVNCVNECKDKKAKKFCEKQKKENKCKTEKIYKQCKKTCDECGAQPPPPEECKDQKPKKFCQKQKMENKCKKEKIYKQCKKTCDECDAQPPPPEECEDKKIKKFCKKQKDNGKCKEASNKKDCKKTCGHC